MKKLLALLLAVCVVMGCAGAMADEAPSALYPIRENGLWGYMNRAGEVVIEPQFAEAESFTSSTAIVAQTQQNGKPVFGIIDQHGTPVVPIEYEQIEDCGPYYVVCDTEDWDEWVVGWYDKTSGYFQEPAYLFIDDTPSDSFLVAVDMEVVADEDGLIIRGAYIDRRNGEIAMLYDLSGEPYSTGTFREGYAYWLIEREEAIDEFLLDLTFQRVKFPDGIWPRGDVREGVLPIIDDKELFGLAKPDGTVILQPLYDLINAASEGRMFFEQDGKLGIMDLEGNVILPASLDWEPGWDDYGGGEEHFFRNGYALARVLGDGGTEMYVYLNRDGKIVWSSPVCTDEDTMIAPYAYVMEGGKAWIQKIEQQPDDTNKLTACCLIQLTEDGSEDLSGYVFDKTISSDGSVIDFHEGLLHVRQKGLWGYINEQAQWVIPPQYDSADNYRDGLALVEKDGKLMYIDHSGAVVWEER